MAVGAVEGGVNTRFQKVEDALPILVRPVCRGRRCHQPPNAGDKSDSDSILNLITLRRLCGIHGSWSPSTCPPHLRDGHTPRPTCTAGRACLFGRPASSGKGSSMKLLKLLSIHNFKKLI